MKNPKKYFERFLSGASRISRVWGRHSPTRFPQGQNERKANFGTAVESCSEKLPLSSAADFAAIYKGRCGCFRQYSDCGGVSCPPLFPSTDRNGKCQTLIWIFHHYYGRQASISGKLPRHSLLQGTGRFAKNGKKNATDFQNLWRCCLEQYSILVSRSSLWAKEKDNRFWLSCENVYYVVLCMIDKIKFEDHSSTKYLYAAASSSLHIR
ncbi:MAG: hypothetical protein ACLUS6_16325 [Dysosmobacter sp.]